MKEIMIITGASSGIGREFALQLTKKHKFDEVWLIARRKELLEELGRELEVKTRILPYDVTNDEEIERIKKLLHEENPKVKYLINSAGFGRFGNYKEVSLEISQKMIDTNVKAMVNMTMITLDFMHENSHICNLGSASAFFPLINFNVYAATKAFVVHYSNALHDELKERKISVTVLCPGWVRTSFFDVAKNEDHIHGPKAYKPMLEVDDVVRKTIRAIDKNKKMFIYNFYTKFHYFGSRFFPRFIMLGTWKKMQKK